jgi:hypothetical protein
MKIGVVIVEDLKENREVRTDAAVLLCCRVTCKRLLGSKIDLSKVWAQPSVF